MGTTMSRWQGGAMGDQVSGGRVSGELGIEFDRLVSIDGQTRHELPLAGLRFRLGGANHSLVLFEHPAHPGLTLFTRGHAVLAHPSLHTPAFAADLAAARSAKRGSGLLLGAILAIFGLLLLGLWMARDPLVAGLAKAVPRDWEAKAGDLAFKQLSVQAKFIEDKALLADFKTLAKPLLAVQPADAPEFQFHIADDGVLNAFALPGGHVILNRGLILGAKRPEEVLGVLAHELVHVTGRHSVRQIIKSAGIFALVQFILGDVSGVLAVLLSDGTYLLSMKHSRDFEREADNVGWDLLLQAGVDPRGMAEFFAKLKIDQAKSPLASAEKALALIGTHPSLDERIERLKDAEKTLKNRAFKPIQFDWRSFQARLRRAR